MRNEPDSFFRYFTHAWSFGQYAGVGLQLGIVLWTGLGLFGVSVASFTKLALSSIVSLGAWIATLVVSVGIYTAISG